MEEILRASEEEAIASLYSQIRQDPEFMEAIDRKHFADTPLHLAAGEGRTLLALEIQRLMPSFGRKLNPDGLTPVDLALRQGHRETVGAMIKVNPELVRVKGREGITPLHYVAATDDEDLLAELLLTCPESIDELTVRGESAVHVAVRNGKRAAFWVLYGWLIKYGRRDVLGWKDWEGNTILHVAASTNRPAFMEELLTEGITRVNEKNGRGLTALDIVMGLPTELNRALALKVLQSFGGKRGSTIRHQMVANAKYLSSKETKVQKIIKLGAWLDVDIGLRSEMRSTLLVVAILIVTATYPAVLSPLGNQNNNSSSSTGNDNNNTSTKSHDNADFYTFMLLNSLALAVSLGFIFVLLPVRRYTFLLHVSMIFLMLSYLWATSLMWPLNKPGQRFTLWFSMLYFCLLIISKIYLVALRYSFVLFNWLFVVSDKFHSNSKLIMRLFEDKYHSQGLFF